MGHVSPQFPENTMQTQIATTPAFGSASLIDPAYAVTLPSGEQGTWNISQNLTCRWGELNDAFGDTKPLQPLVDNPELLEGLINQMWDELTFIVRKDGQYGILFENEYCSKQSEVNMIRPDQPGYDAAFASLPDEEVLRINLLSFIAKLAAKYPKVLFCLPPKEEMVEERLGIWAFVSDGLLSQEELEALGRDILEI